MSRHAGCMRAPASKVQSGSTTAYASGTFVSSLSMPQGVTTSMWPRDLCPRLCVCLMTCITQDECGRQHSRSSAAHITTASMNSAHCQCLSCVVRNATACLVSRAECKQAPASKEQSGSTTIVNSAYRQCLACIALNVSVCLVSRAECMQAPASKEQSGSTTIVNSAYRQCLACIALNVSVCLVSRAECMQAPASKEQSGSTTACVTRLSTGVGGCTMQRKRRPVASATSTTLCWPYWSC